MLVMTEKLTQFHCIFTYSMNTNSNVASSLRRTKIRSSETMVSMIAENIRDTKRLNQLFKQLDKEKKLVHDYYESKYNDLQAELDYKIKRASISVADLKLPKVSLVEELDKKEDAAKKSIEEKPKHRVSVTPFSKILIDEDD